MADNKKGSKYFDFTKDSNTGRSRFDFTKDEPAKSHIQKYGKWYSFGGIGLVCLAAIFFWIRNQVVGVVLPPVDTQTRVANRSVVEKKDSATNGKRLTPVKKDVIKKQKEISTDAPEVKEEPNANNVTISASSSNIRSGDINIDAKKAIRGDFGNGLERCRLLGDDYEQVQALVNKMYREGNLHW